MDLFDMAKKQDSSGPLAHRMRPTSLEEFLGQEHLVGKNGILRRMIEQDRLHSFILYGPPGTGKTTLAFIIAAKTRSHFEHLKAVTGGTADIKNIAQDAEHRLKFYQQRTILFIDEVHRFNKAQQDVLLPYVESGLLTLIGATTENPLFEINAALLSRLKIYILHPLREEEISILINRALTDHEKGLGKRNLTVTPQAVSAIASFSKGDARVALNLLETAANAKNEEENGIITEEDIEQTRGHLYLNYDKKGDAHYDTISAFIKSIRGSDPDAALFWLAVMIHGGEDPLFIARRLVIHAAEDVGLADPRALEIAVAALQAVHFVGWPEAKIPLAQATIYLATAPKSNSSKAAIDAALRYVEKLNHIEVPSHIADASHSRSHLLGKGVGYKYPHDFGGYVEQDYLPPGVENPKFYRPSENGEEVRIKEFLQNLEKLKKGR